MVGVSPPSALQILFMTEDQDSHSIIYLESALLNLRPSTQQRRHNGAVREGGWVLQESKNKKKVKEE
jgi:hypothetical protein